MARHDGRADGRADGWVDDLLADVARRDPAMRPAFVDDLVAQAKAEQPALGALSEPGAAVAMTPGWFALLGGWRAALGLAAASVAGLWLGVAPPTALASTVESLTGASYGSLAGSDADPLAFLESAS